MDVSDDDVSKNEEDYDSDADDDDESLATFCARMSQSLSGSSQETVLMKSDAGGDRVGVTTRSSRKIGACPFCNQRDPDVSGEVTLSTNSKKLCSVCDLIM
jgi:hypothetical protein